MNNHLKGDRIILREMKEQDWEEVHAYASQPIVCQFQPWGPNSEKESQEFVKQVLVDAMKNPRSRFVFAVMEKERLIGAGEINIRDFGNHQGEIGYIVHPDYWAKGYATEVSKMLIEFGFRTLHLHRIFATCDPRNVGSVKVLEKIGMTNEGRLREALLVKDGWRDSLLYSILKREWQTL
ncbi:GNAT family N-acetyltransferase [Lysinibacillus sp. NPDC097195]|uniref:GNAT family N-acetyltransferase n=1 Tax=Lysinibacillus sp. NPDC097195 TaxID=3364141 RepID=UPI003806D29D